MTNAFRCRRCLDDSFDAQWFRLVIYASERMVRDDADAGNEGRTDNDRRDLLAHGDENYHAGRVRGVTAS
jgi:hypothetical protein